ncbi:hypothetical protein K450DRAFT_283121 [Umbelopsis ramanniana AG]|uniref:Galactose oxidase n=1 Tax=Umbelopsis ramanniana AG TaxID=1314678 RepID=A0AAD5HC38_UMBRA|nr:uncharacterized protein K450DRAFT_283121 [Umbelopsis ramanniana AG]KAI8576783.1 hypothetical protein K450DRAFT_283121 [Umbelopsis ramanniana AG]
MKLWFPAVTAFSFLFQLTNAASVTSRSAGVCAAVQRKVFCYGGYDIYGNITSDTWSIDASTDFALSGPSWTNITDNNFVTTATGYGVGVALNDGVSFLVNGGLSNPTNTTETNQTTVLNTATNTWTAINSSLITQTRQHTAVVDANGKVWLWGGVSDYKTGNLNTSYWGAFTTLNPVTWEWGGPDSGNSGPNARVGHTMTITPSGKIIIIGGLVATKSSTLDAQGYMQWTLSGASSSDVPQYDTGNGLWNLVTATGSIPASRTLHSATLAADGTSIIVFGGATDDLNSVYGDLHIFDTVSNAWTVLNISNGPNPRAAHNAVQINTTMFVMFGWDFTFAPLSDIHALDTVNWRWVSEYSASGYPLLSANTTTNTTNTTSPDSNNNSSSKSSQNSGSLSTGAIAGIAVGAVVVVIGVGAFLVFYFRRKNKKSPLQMEPATGNYGQPPPMQEKPLPPQHQYSNQPEEIIFNDGSRSDAKDSYYAQSTSQQHHNSFIGSQGYTASSEQAEDTPPYSAGLRSPNTYDTITTSKPDAHDVPHFTLQPSKPNEDD